MDPSTAAAELARWSGLATPVLALAGNVVVQILQVRSTRGAHFLRSMVVALLAGGLFLLALEVARAAWLVFSPAALAEGLIVNGPIYLCLSYCYFNFVNLGQTSVRIRVYTEIEKRPDGMDPDEIGRLYDEQALMRLRVHRLVEGGDLKHQNGRYRLGHRRLLFLANPIFFAKRLLLGKESEFSARDVGQ